MVAYTRGLEEYHGDQDGALAHVQASIASANVAFENRQINLKL